VKSLSYVLERLKEGAWWFAGFLAALGVGSFLIAWSGFYSVAASRGHWPGFSLFLEFGMRNSVRTHALAIDVPDLDDAALIERGAGHFQGGCVPCHGAPGQASNPIVHAMLPNPPDLGATVPTWKPNQLFWIVKHGLKYTGMPAWAAQTREDEVWAVVAFLLHLPKLDTAKYRSLASVDPRDQQVPIHVLAQGGPVGSGLSACSRCHGVDGKGRPSGAFPRLDIQSAEYLLAQLQAYAGGSRHSGIMQPVAAELDAAEMERLARYYSAQPDGSLHEPVGDENNLALGRSLAREGLPKQGIPPCFSCHAEEAQKANRNFPTIVGQYASYTSQQLELFRSGKRRDTPAAKIMAAIAERLSATQITAVSAYLAQPQQRAGENAGP
jgi:cytochrome c553